MDGLALLCNLFADGPVTLRRLRAARVANLSELERAAPERLASWLHASIPQARAFIEEARKLLRRLADAEPPALAGPPLRALRSLASARAVEGCTRPSPVPVLSASTSSNALTLRPGLFPGLDESVCARLSLHQVRTLQVLCESAGLALARRTGIPYSTLLELARRARRWSSAPARAHAADAAPALAERVLVPFVSHPRRAPAESELVSSDEFTLPVLEPESAGPFG